MSNNPPQFIVSCFHMNCSICLPSRASNHRNKFTESLILYTTRAKVCTQVQQKWKDKVCPYLQNPSWQRLWAGYEIASPAQQIIFFITVTSLNQSTWKQLIAQKSTPSSLKWIKLKHTEGIKLTYPAYYHTTESEKTKVQCKSNYLLASWIGNHRNTYQNSIGHIYYHSKSFWISSCVLDQPRQELLPWLAETLQEKKTRKKSQLLWDSNFHSMY